MLQLKSMSVKSEIR